eukprot:6974384-Heterocapsa_arctica.AAC.1
MKAVADLRKASVLDDLLVVVRHAVVVVDARERVERPEPGQDLALIGVGDRELHGAGRLHAETLSEGVRREPVVGGCPAAKGGR